MKYVTPVLVNRHKGEFDIYIGRGSKWGNPFPVDKAKGHTRQYVVEMYRQYLYDGLESGIFEIEDFLELSGLRIGCSCAPLVCHGDVIIEVFNTIVEMLNESK